MPVHKLLAALADGQPHHITELAHLMHYAPQQLNGLWQQVPPHLYPLLRQKDGLWQLAKPVAVLPERFRAAGFTVKVLPETESTNTVLLDRTRAGAPIHQQVVIAQQQTQGRGRQGKNWHNRIGESLLFSIGWTFAQEQSQLGALAAVTALACQSALVQLGCPAQIKWPNDLVIDLDKLGGILIETVRKNGQTHAVIGIGLNFMQPENVENATSFQATAGKTHTAAAVLEQVLQKIYSTLEQFARSGFTPFQAAYQAAHRDHNRQVCLLHNDQVSTYGRVTGIGGNGELLLANERGQEQIVCGEVSLRLPQQLSGSLNHPRLLLDGGNSRLKWAWVEGSNIIRTGHAPYRDLSRLQQDWQQYGSWNTQITGSAVCGTAKQAAVQTMLPHPIEWLGSMSHALGITNHYRNHHEHGADRWFNALGSRRFSQNAAVIVSCGTAVTIDALTADGHYLGGSIMPGFHLMRESLNQKTAQLQRPEGNHYPFPTTTANAIATGMIDAVCGAIVLMHSRLKERSGGQPTDIILTGGGASKIARALPAAFTLDNSVKIVDNLVIYGLINWIGQK